MKIHFLILLLSATTSQGVVYSNTFDSPAALNDFAIYGEQFIGYNPPSLHNVAVSDGQLIIETTYLQPNLPVSPNPTLFGGATVSINTVGWGSGYNSILSQNAGRVSWSFNVANQDGAYNNSFVVILASTTADPRYQGGQGYYLSGGGGGGNIMRLARFGNGLYGLNADLITISAGLAPLPQMGSIRVEYSPLNNQWSLFGTLDTSYHDPTLVSTLLGIRFDDTYTQQSTPWFALHGSTTGKDYYDNLTVQVVPEPSSGLLGLFLGALVWSTRTGKNRAPRKGVLVSATPLL